MPCTGALLPAGPRTISLRGIEGRPGEAIDLSKHGRPRYPAAFANVRYLSDVRSLYPLLLQPAAGRAPTLTLTLTLALALTVTLALALTLQRGEQRRLRGRRGGQAAGQSAQLAAQVLLPRGRHGGVDHRAEPG